MFYETVWTHLLVLPVSLTYEGFALSFTSLLNHVSSAVAQTPYSDSAQHAVEADG